VADRSAIEWTDATWNPIRALYATPDGPKTGWHCEHVSEGCRNCYAEGLNRWVGTGFDYKPGHLARPLAPFPGAAPRGDVSLFLDEKMLLAPLKWREPRRIFVGSMTDLFADFVIDAWLDRMFAVMALCPQHVFQVLTKRPERMRRWFDRYDAAHDHNRADMVADRVAALLGREGAAGAARVDERWRGWPLPNVWLGTSTENRAALLDRAGHLRKTPAAVRFFSCEPLLGDLGDVVLSDIDWVICGGESGPHARPMHPDWARSLRDQCAAAGVPFFFKQWGEWAPGENALDDRRYRTVHEWDGGWIDCADDWSVEKDHGPLLYRIGKRAAGRHLDGVLHDGMPVHG
jgi:protein gp37